MTTSLLAFKVGLFEEHLDEIGFLASQAQAMRTARHHSWTDAGPFEQRLEAHLDALLVGGSLALQVGKARAAQADANELFGIAALACRAADLPLLQHIAHGSDLDDQAKLASISHALVAEWPATWREQCLRGLGQGDSRLAPTLAAVAACRGWPTQGQLSAALQRAPAAQRVALLGEVGRCQEDQALDLARAHYGDTDPSVREAALRAGLRLHDPQARSLVLTGPQRPLLAALTASRTAMPQLLTQLIGADTPLPVIQALGLMGDLAAVRALVALLAFEAVAAPAAQALHLITGAPLHEQVLVPELADEDTLSEAEAERFRQSGAWPTRLDGQPFGERVDRLSQDPAVWGQWLADHGSEFTAGCRYRLGQPCTVAWMLHSLAEPHFPAPWRALLNEELQCRHGLKLLLRPELPVQTQQTLLQHQQAHALALDSHHKPGRWHAAGTELFD